jgi:rSAM/selenodomain-associated transferase 1
VLGIFAKEPRPGQVKTRLAGPTSAGWAAQVAEAFLLDTLDRLARFDATRVLAVTPSTAHGYFLPLCQHHYRLELQEGDDLGLRMAGFFLFQFSRAGAHAVVLIGTDSPTLPTAYIQQAFEELTRADVVIGPATDGGYYLLGCVRRVLLPPLFKSIPWSTSRVLSESVAALQDAGWRLALLPPWYDVDTLDDWHMLRGHVAALRRAGQDPGVPRTEKLLLGPLP